MGTGPFKYESYVPGDNIMLSAHEEYRVEGEPKVDGILFRIVTDATTRAMEAESGRADIVYGISNTEMESIDAAEGVSVVSDISTQTIYFMMNCAQAPMDDIRVRQAIALTIDVGSVIKAACSNFGSAAQGWVAPGVLGYEPFTYERDVERAKELMSEAGYGGGLEIEVIVPNSAQERVNMAEAIQGQLSEIGITLTITPMDGSAAGEYTTAGKHQSTIQGYSCTSFEADRALCQVIPEAYYYPLTSPQNEAIFDLYDESMATMDTEARGQVYMEAIRIIKDEYLYVPLWHKGINAAVNDRIGGFVLDRSLEVHDLSSVYFN